MPEHANAHPWITFELDLRKVPYRVWLLLGEAASKCDHLAGVPLQPEFAREMHRVYLAKGVLATTAIEGNTLTEEEVRAILDHRLTLPPSKAYLQREVDNILEACNSVISEPNPGRITPERLRSFNRQVLNGLEVAEEVVAGDFRTCSVGVGRYRAPNWQEIPALVDRYCSWLDEISSAAPSDFPVPFALLRAIFAHLYLAWVHPFGDGNGRTARLVELSILMGAGVPTPAAHLLSNFYNETRSEYYRHLDAASHRQDPWEFVTYAIGGFSDQIRAQVDKVRQQHIVVCWLNYVNEVLHDQRTPASRRQRDLILALSAKKAPIPRSQLKTIDPVLAASYSGRTSKTLTRDLHALEQHGLLGRITTGEYVANIGTILSFLPTRKKA